MAAKDDLLFVAKRFRAVIDLIPALEEMDTVEDSISEKRRQLEDLIVAHRGEVRKFEDIQDEVKEARGRANNSAAQHNIEVTERMRELIQQIRTTREKAEEQLRKDTAQLRKEYDTMVRNVQKQKGRLDTLTIELDEKTLRLKKTTDALEKLKSQL